MDGTKVGATKRAYTNGETNAIVDSSTAHKNSVSMTDHAAKFSASVGTVKSIWNRRYDNCNHGGSSRKRQRDGIFKNLEQEVYQFVLLARSLRLPVTGAVIKAKAESLRTKFGLTLE